MGVGLIHSSSHAVRNPKRHRPQIASLAFIVFFIHCLDYVVVLYIKRRREGGVGLPTGAKVVLKHSITLWRGVGRQGNRTRIAANLGHFFALQPYGKENHVWL